MKVLILPSWYPSLRAPYDGIFIQEQAEALARAGLEVAVLHGEMKLSKLLKPSQLTSTLENGVKVIRKSGFALPKANAFLIKQWATKQKDLLDRYVSENGKPDLIHAHSFIAGHFGKYAKEITGAPLLLTEHHSELLREKQNQRYLAFAKDCYDHCDHIIAVSSALQKAINALSETKVDVIPNLVDTKLFFPNPKGKTSAGECKILGVGSFDENKGYQHLIEALPLLQKMVLSLRFSLDLIGSGPLQEKFEQLISAKKLNESVRLHAPMPKKELAAYYNTADIFCLPSKVETFGVVLIEALACGTAVLATSKGGPRDIINDRNGKLADFGNSESLAKALKEMCVEKNNYDSIRIGEETKERFGEEAVVKKIIACYEKMLRKKA